ncbi:MAG: DUF1292 domain-containing protein [Lachnospiraceae bacterium]|nr:DUF1292 domain-containing protein [Lachnospiraceae bacterium]
MQQPDEEMSVDIELEDGTNVHCEVLTVLEVNGQDYVALVPDGQDDAEEVDVWFYELIEDPEDENAEPELRYIESDDVYEAVADKFDEYLDELEYDEAE